VSERYPVLGEPITLEAAEQVRASLIRSSTARLHSFSDARRALGTRHSFCSSGRLSRAW
jgi:hypothetical protein